MPRTQSRNLMRRLRLGPRLALLYALPLLGLAAVAIVLNIGQWREVLAIDRYNDLTSEAFASLDVAAAVQAERHAGFDSNSPDAVTAAIRAVDGLAESEGVTLSDLRIPRAQVADGRLPDLRPYRVTITDLTDSAERSLADAPSESIAAQTSAHIALRRAVEAGRYEDLLIRGATFPFTAAAAREIGEAHQVETSELQSATLLADPTIARQITAATFEPTWRSIIDLRSQIVSGTALDVQQQWTDTNRIRLAQLDDIAAQDQTLTLNRIDEERGDARSRALATTILTGLAALACLLSFRLLRSSIAEPVTNLRSAIAALIRGEVQPHEVTSTDEMGQVERSLVDLEAVMERLEQRSNEVEAEIAAGNVSARIPTEEFSGFWLDRVTAHNQALDEMEQAVAAAADADSTRRWIASIDRDAARSTSVESFLATVVEHLELSDPGISLSVGDLRPEWFGRDRWESDGEHVIDVENGPLNWVLAVPMAQGGPQAPALLARRSGPWGHPATVLAHLVATSHACERLIQRLDAAKRTAWDRTHDTATGLINQRGLEALIETKITQDLPPAWLVCLEPCDLRLFDDSFGSVQRSEALSVFGRRVNALNDGRFTVARLSETEFAIVGEGDLPLGVIGDIRRAFRQPVTIGGGALRISVAIGWAHHEHDLGPSELLAAGRSACRASATERPVIPVEYRSELRDQATRSLELRQWLESSLRDDTLEVWYQPIGEVHSRSTAGYEALCRGRLNGELVPPAEFIPLAEQHGLIGPLTEHVLATALNDIGELPGTDPYVTVNLSPISLRDPRIVGLIRSHLHAAEVPPERLMLEITEGAFVDDDPAVAQRLDALTDLGLRLAIDDFGTGYSSLAYLTDLPVKVVKIDRSLIEPLNTHATTESVVARTVELAHDLGLTVVAEGVETTHQLDRLTAIGADTYQGWLLGAPQPLSAFRSTEQSP